MKMIRRFLPIILLTFVNVIGFTLLIPVLTDVSKLYVSEQYSGIVYGGLLSVYAFCQFLGAPILGSISDKYGRKPILFVSQLGTTLSWVVFGAAYFVSPDTEVFGISLALIVIALARIIDGITGGNISVANAWISDVTTRKEKAEAFGLLGAVFGLGLLIGPVLGGLSSATDIGFLGTAITAFIISAITLAFINFYLPESLPEEQRDKELEIRFWSEVNIWKKFTEFKTNASVRDLLTIRLFFALVFASYTTLIALLLSDNYGLDSTGVGLFIGAIGLFAIFNQAVLVRFFVKKFGNVWTLYFSLIVMFFGLVVLPFLPTSFTFAGQNLALLIFLINAYVMNLGIALGQPTFKALLANNVADSKQGKINGLDESLLSLGNGVTPLMAGTLYSFMGSFVFIAYAVLLAVPVSIVYLLSGGIEDPD
jgi:MFS family permease